MLTKGLPPFQQPCKTRLNQTNLLREQHRNGRSKMNSAKKLRLLLTWQGHPSRLGEVSNGFLRQKKGGGFNRNRPASLCTVTRVEKDRLLMPSFPFYSSFVGFSCTAAIPFS